MLHNFKIAVLSFSLTFFFGASVVSADMCEELRPVLDKYYQASQEENIDDYMAVMDVDYVRENLLDNYEDYVKSAWEVYDTKEYTIENYNCKVEENVGLMYFNLAATLESGGESVETQRNYVALFSKPDGWKIRYVMDEDVFSQFQSSLYTQLFLDATKENIDKTAEDAETVVEYARIEEELLAGDYENTVSEGLPERETSQGSDGGGGSKLVYLFIFGLIVGTYLFVKNKKASADRNSD